jgi:DNA-binding beta-propeller fold protein YncE
MQYLPGASIGIVVAGGNGQGISNLQLNNPRGLYYDSLSNSLLIANTNAHNIVRWVLGDGSWTLVAGSSSGLSGNTSLLLESPPDVKLDSMGNIYVADEGNLRIQLFLSGQSNGTTIAGVTSTPGSTSILFNTPCGLAVDSEFNLYVADIYNARVQKFVHN